MTVVSNNVMIVESLGIKTSFIEVTGPSKINVPQGMMLVEGVLGVANTKNRNNRYYTLEEYKRHIDTFMLRVNEENGVFGEMEHPKSMNIDLNNVSHKIMDVRIDESTGEVKGTLLLLDTPKGLIAQSVVRSGSPLPVSSRALGAVNPKTGETVLEFLSTWDLVGTSGFKQATVKQISESVEDSNMVVESLEFALNADQHILEESKTPEIHSTEIKEIVENYLASRSNTEVNENDNDDEVLETKMHELFVTQYAPIIEQWINSTYTNKLTAGIQSWLVESFAPQLQSWIVETYTPEIANSIQSWVTESFAPEIGNAVQSWVTEDYSTQVQSWVTEEFAPVVQSWVTEEFAPAYGEVVENWLMADALPQLQVVENANAITSTATIAPEIGNAVQPTQATQAQIFKSAILESLDAKINDAKAIAKPEPVVERVDEAMFKTGPAWLKNIPTEFKAAWTALNESQREKVYRKAAIRTFETLNDVNTFWNGIDFQSLVESQVNTSVLTRTINENVQPSFKANAGVFAAAKALSGRK